MDHGAILHFLNEPVNGWQKFSAGPFDVYEWPHDEPPGWQGAWLTGTAIPQQCLRAFQAKLPATAIRRMNAALETVRSEFGRHGMRLKKNWRIPIILWDPHFPLPDDWDAIDPEDAPITLYTCNADSPPVVILMCHDRGRMRTPLADWLEACTLHEGFHALLCCWRKENDKAFKLLKSSIWAKFEEMCAVAMEARLLPDNSVWLDYMFGWRSSLPLSCADNDLTELALATGSSFELSVNQETYGHFAFLAYLNDVVWPADVPWLRLAWKESLKKNIDTTPWSSFDTALVHSGGIAAAYARYAMETRFPGPFAVTLRSLNAKCGPPCAVGFNPGSKVRVFPLGPLSAQWFRLKELAKAGSKVLQITPYRGEKHLVVRVFHADGSAIGQHTLQTNKKPVSWTYSPSIKDDDVYVLIAMTSWQSAAAIRVEWR